ncbi:hypothetical protein HK13_13135 [Acetobacter indonesiensis]|nr:hypothetical protein HK13_13135 [Acetobacter indonesiensis]
MAQPFQNGLTVRNREKSRSAYRSAFWFPSRKELCIGVCVLKLWFLSTPALMAQAILVLLL